MKLARLFPFVLCVVLAQPSAVRSEPFATAFTYQAQLDQGGSPLNGTADCRFELFGVDVGGTPVGAAVVFTNQTVTDGLLNVRLDYGVDVFDGSSRWLEIAIRSPHDPSNLLPYTTLTPRQPVSPIPYALQTRGIFVNENEKVSIGAPVQAMPISKFRILAEAADPIALLAESPAITGDAVGIKGTTASLMGRGVEGSGPGKGVLGRASATSGATIGVEGKSDSVAGIGVAGEALAEGVRGKASGAGGKGVCGIVEATTGDGVLGHASATMGTTTGVHGISDSPIGTGVVGEAMAEGVLGKATGPGGKGVCGIAEASTGDGVLGHASATMGTTTGVHGTSASPAGIGVLGESLKEGVQGKATGPGGKGVCGIIESTSGDGVLGHASATTGTTTGVHGTSASPNGTGVLGESLAEGVQGKATGPGGKGVCGIVEASTGDGVLGVASAASGPTTGVRGTANSPGGTGVVGQAVTEGVCGMATTTTGPGIGVRGTTASPTGAGVLGCASDPGQCSMFAPGSSQGVGVFGYASQPNGTTGVEGQTNSPFGQGVLGRGPWSGVRGELNNGAIGEFTFGILAHNAFGPFGPVVTGVYGTTELPDGNGVMGEATAPTGPAIGVVGRTYSNFGIAILAEAVSPEGPTVGIQAECPSPDGFAGYFLGRGYFSGFVGIGDFLPTGDVDPKAPLHVIGNGPPPDFRTMIVESDNNEGTWLSLRNTSADGHDWNLVSAGSGGPGNGKLRFVDDPGGGLGTARMVIDRSGGGRVGIATETPSTTLDVNGTCKMTGFQLTAGGPLNGKVLTSDVSGVGTWQTLPPAPNAWSPTGNAGTNPTNNFLGTTDNQGLSLRTNNSVRVMIASGGNVGIGMQIPTAKLHVGGTAGVDGIRFPDGTLQTTAAVEPETAWNLNGNAGTSPGTDFIGTTDNQPFQIHVNGGRAIRIEPTASTPNLIGGYSGNSVTAGKVGATIGGGGTADQPNTVTNDYGTVAGGVTNTAGGIYSSVGGGQENSAAAAYATISGGGPWDPDFDPTNTNNRVFDDYGTIGGGGGNRQGSDDADPFTATYATVGGGEQNIAGGILSTVSGGAFNTASGGASIVGGGAGNDAVGDNSTVGGGQNNTASGFMSTIGGGDLNTADGGLSTIGGGRNNVATGAGYSTVGGGFGNTASGFGATCPGGVANRAGGDYSFAAGRQAKVRDAATVGDLDGDQGTFAWADSTSADFQSTGPNQFLVRASGGIYLGANSTVSIPAGRFINTSTGAFLSTAGAWTSSSDRDLKEGFVPVDAQAILARVAELEISEWSYKVEKPSIRHVGPMAQDFHAGFGLGDSDRHISTIDADGVALAAIQGLYEIVQERDCRIDELEAKVKSVEELEAKLASLEALLAKLTDQRNGGGR